MDVKEHFGAFGILHLVFAFLSLALNFIYPKALKKLSMQSDGVGGFRHYLVVFSPSKVRNITFLAERYTLWRVSKNGTTKKT